LLLAVLNCIIPLRPMLFKIHAFSWSSGSQKVDT
jgi:hypothetical protein